MSEHHALFVQRALSVCRRFAFSEAVSSVQDIVQDVGVRLRSEKVNGRRTALKPSCCCLKTIVLKSAACALAFWLLDIAGVV